jgi:hypothetical protein
LEGLPGIKAIADDIIIYGKGKTNEEALCDHDNNVLKLPERCQERNIKLNKETFQLLKTEMSFVTDTGVKPDLYKVDANMNMPRPTDKKALQRFLGLVRSS